MHRCKTGLRFFPTCDMTTEVVHVGDGDGGDPPSSKIYDIGHKASLRNKTFRVTGYMADLHTLFVGVDGRPSPDTASSLTAAGAVRGLGQPSPRSCEHLTLQAAVRCVLAHTHASESLQLLLCQQVHDRWRYRYTQWAKAHSDTELPEVLQQTHGNRRKVMRVLPISDAMATARRLIKAGLEEMTQEITDLTASLNLKESASAGDDDNVEED